MLKGLLEEEGRGEEEEKIRSMNNKMAMTMYLSTISLNVNVLTASIKRHVVAEWVRKQDLYACCLQGILQLNTHTD